MQNISRIKRIERNPTFIRNFLFLVKKTFVLFSFLVFTSLSATAQDMQKVAAAREHYKSIIFFSGEQKAKQALMVVVTYEVRKANLNTDWANYLNEVITNPNRNINPKNQNWVKSFNEVMLNINQKLNAVATHAERICDTNSCCSSWAYQGNPWEFDHWSCQK